MGLFGKIFGGDFASNRADGDRFFADRRHGEAKLAYEAALSRAKGVAEADVAHVRERLDACRKELADAYLAEASTLADQGRREDALDRLGLAADLAPSAEVQARIDAARDALDRAEARADAEPEEVDEEELYAVLSGAWEEEQVDEYEEYGDDKIRPIVLALHEGRAEDAQKAIEALLSGAEEPCYLHFEHARALLALGKKEEGGAALRRFLGALGPDEGGRVRAGAHEALARLAIEANDDAAAEAELRACADALPEDVDPLVLLARFLRKRGRMDEALEAAEEAVDRMGTIRPHLPAMRELGLALVGKGESKRAIGVLESAVEIYAGNDDFDFDPEFAITLARLHEEAGDPAHAADFYRHLAAGSDRANHYRYNLEAGRLLALASRGADARRYLARALELAKDDAERAAVEERLQSL